MSHDPMVARQMPINEHRIPARLQEAGNDVLHLARGGRLATLRWPGVRLACWPRAEPLDPHGVAVAVCGGRTPKVWSSRWVLRAVAGLWLRPVTGRGTVGGRAVGRCSQLGDDGVGLGKAAPGGDPARG